MGIFIIEKKVGETPREAITRLRRERQELKDEKITYAGRLDPLASGKLLLLSGDDVYRKEEFLQLEKTYIVKLILGIATDTGDLLGLVKNFSIDINIQETEKAIQTICDWKGEYHQPYPNYSSKTIQGKPLWQLARQGNHVDIPFKKVIIHNISAKLADPISGQQLVSYAKKIINLVHGDFRQKEILETWKNFLENHTSVMFPRIAIRCRVSSGTYMRGFPNRLQNAMGIPSVVMSIKREKIGKGDEPWNQ